MADSDSINGRYIEQDCPPNKAGRLTEEKVGAGESGQVDEEKARALCEDQGSNGFLSILMNAISDPIFVKDRDHRLVLVNASYCHFVGRTPEQLIAKSVHEIYPREIANQSVRHERRVFETGKEETVEENFTDAAGYSRTFLIKKNFTVTGTAASL